MCGQLTYKNKQRKEFDWLLVQSCIILTAAEKCLYPTGKVYTQHMLISYCRSRSISSWHFFWIMPLDILYMFMPGAVWWYINSQMFMKLNFVNFLIRKTGGWSGLFILREIIRYSFLFGLNFTNQDFAYFDILLRSVLRISAAASGLSIIIYRLVSSETFIWNVGKSGIL